MLSYAKDLILDICEQRLNQICTNIKSVCIQIILANANILW